MITADKFKENIENIKKDLPANFYVNNDQVTEETFNLVKQTQCQKEDLRESLKQIIYFVQKALSPNEEIPENPYNKIADLKCEIDILQDQLRFYKEQAANTINSLTEIQMTIKS